MTITNYGWQIGSNFDKIKTGDYVENHPSVPIRIFRHLTKDGNKLHTSDKFVYTAPKKAKVWAYEDLLNLKREEVKSEQIIVNVLDNLKQEIDSHKGLVIQTCLDKSYQGSINIDMVSGLLINSLGFGGCIHDFSWAELTEIQKIIKNIWDNRQEPIAPATKTEFNLDKAIASHDKRQRKAALKTEIKAKNTVQPNLFGLTDFSNTPQLNLFAI
jgi:hypothetical protein